MKKLAHRNGIREWMYETFAYPKAIYEAKIKLSSENKICFNAINSPCFMCECNTKLFAVSQDPKFFLLRLCQLDARAKKLSEVSNALDFHGEK
jgi:hypothetical protein